MKKEVMDILQNEFVFDRLSGSAGNITAVSMGYKHYFREKGKTICPNTEHQQTHHQVLRRGVTAWQSLTMEKQEQWNRLAGGDLGIQIALNALAKVFFIIFAKKILQ